MRKWTMEMISRAQKTAAEKRERAWWFAPDTVQFFDSRVEAGPFSRLGGTTHYFVNSTQFHGSNGAYSAPRGYSVCYWDELRPDRIETWGRHQQFKTKEAATRVAELLAKNNGVLHIREVAKE